MAVYPVVCDCLVDDVRDDKQDSRACRRTTVSVCICITRNEASSKYSNLEIYTRHCTVNPQAARQHSIICLGCCCRCKYK